MEELLEGLTWFRGSSVRIRRAGVEVHVDPWGAEDEGTADYVLLTHPHYDNFSEDDIERVRSPRTVVVAPSSMKKQLHDADHFMRPGDMLQLDAVDILAVPAHNTEKKFHPPESGWLGYVFTVAGVTYYHAGDTDYLPSMETIRCDVAFLPCGGHYTMGAEDAVRAAESVGAELVVPIHWDEPAGSPDEAERMKEMLPDRVRILERDA